MPVLEFRDQVEEFSRCFEMASLDSALDFLNGSYRPKRDLCMLTFDDGLRDHSEFVLPILAERKISGLFGVISGCVEDRVVAPVHMNHFLTASLDFNEYREALLTELDNWSPGLWEQCNVNEDEAQRSYPLDTREMASFKFVFNFLLPAEIRDVSIRGVFGRYFGDEAAFAKELYMSWDEVRQLQSGGMLLAGHTHSHRPLSTLSSEELLADIAANRTLLDRHTVPQNHYPFSYPYGKRNSYSPLVIERLHEAGFDCAFNTETGHNVEGSPLFELTRIDCKGAVEELRQIANRVEAVA